MDDLSLRDLMDEIEIPDVITAIGDADFEGFVASSLYSQGWSITLRALDFTALESYLDKLVDRQAILIYSTDLPGLTPAGIRLIQRKILRSFGFSSSAQNDALFEEILQRPVNELELISHMRGNIRAPMLRISRPHSLKSKGAKIIGVGSVGHFTGTSTLALNMAFEASLLGKKTLLIDGNYMSPSLAILLGERNLTSLEQWREVAPNLYAGEVTQENLSLTLERIEIAISEFDLIIFDLGSLRGLANLLSDRRWGSQLIAWCADIADQIYVTTTLDLIAISQLRIFAAELERISIKAKVIFVQFGKQTSKRRDVVDARFTHALSSLSAPAIKSLPLDARSVDIAREKQLPLEQVNERGLLRRAIEGLVQEELMR